MDSEIFTVAQTAEYLQLSIKTIRRLISDIKQHTCWSRWI